MLERDGRRYVPVFTSPIHLLRFAPDGGPYLRLPGWVLGSLCPENAAVVVNPGGELGCVVAPEDVARLADAHPPELAEPSISEPAEQPVELLSALRALAERTPQIEALYLAELAHPGAGKELLVGLALVEGSAEQAIVEQAAEAARGAGLNALALLPLGPGTEADPFARFLLDRTKPFFQRGRSAAPPSG